MNLSPRPSTPYLVPFCVLGIALGVANTLQLAEVYACARNSWAAWCAVVMMGCTCGLTLVIAVAMRPVEPEPPVILYKSVQDEQTPAPDYTPLPGREGQSYEATMQRRKPAPEIQMSEPQLARYVMYLLEGDGVVSARGMAHIGTPADTAKVRRWLWRMRWADERNKTAVLHDRGRQALRDLLPHLDRGRE